MWSVSGGLEGEALRPFSWLDCSFVNLCFLLTYCINSVAQVCHQLT